MLVSVAVVPPADVVAEVSDLLARVAGAAEELTPLGSGSLRLPVIGLGNLTRPDAAALCTALADRVVRLRARATIALSGAWALEDGDDPSVALRVVGDVDALTGIATSLPTFAAERGYFVDRRRFVPRLTVARVTDRTTLPVLQEVVDALDGYRSRTWEVTTVDVQQRVHGDGSAFAPFASLPTT